jgi:hypothetical protein
METSLFLKYLGVVSFFRFENTQNSCSIRTFQEVKDIQLLQNLYSTKGSSKKYFTNLVSKKRPRQYLVIFITHLESIQLKI